MNDTEIIKAIREGGNAETEALQHLYLDSDFQSKAKRVVQGNRKLRLLSWDDIFHISLIKLATQIKQGKFSGNTKLVNYFGGICQFTYYEESRKEKKEKEYPDFELPPSSVEDLLTPINLINRKDLVAALEEAIGQLDEKCQEILTLWKLSYSSVEIQEKIGFKSDDVARVSINRCKTKLKKLIRGNKRLMEILKDLRWI